MLYRIQKPDVKKIALVATGANGNTWHLLKQAPQPGEIIKASGDDWRIAYIVVAEPGKVEGGGIAQDGSVAKGDDGQPIQDVWDEASIREAAHSFARNGGLTVDAHFTDGQTLGRWAESYIAPVDHQIEGRPIKQGSWVLGIEPSPEGRQAIVDGRIGGVSVEGSSLREPVLKAEGDVEDELLEDVAVALVKATLAKAAHGPYRYRHGWIPISPADVSRTTYYPSMMDPKEQAKTFGFHISTGGDAVPGGYNGYIEARDPVTGKSMGRLDYNSTSGHGSAVIADINVDPAYARRGVATNLLQAARAELPAHSWQHGMTTEQGSAWRNHLPAHLRVGTIPPLRTAEEQTRRDAAERLFRRTGASPKEIRAALDKAFANYGVAKAARGVCQNPA